MRGRPPKIDPPIEWAIMVPSSLASRIELMLYDPSLGRTRYGSRSELIVSLLQQWAEARKRPLAEERTIDARPQASK